MTLMPSLRSCGSFSTALTGRIALSACQMQIGSTLGLWKPPVRHLHNITPPSPSELHTPPPLAVGHSSFPELSYFLSVPCRHRNFCSSPPPPHCRFHHKGLPVSDHRVHHHIEDGGRHWIDLRDASLSAEGLSVVPSHPCHHLEPLPIPAEEAEGPGPHAISLQYTQAHGHIQGIVCLVQVQEYFMEHPLTQG